MSSLPEPSLVNESRARDLVAGIEDPTSRTLVSLLVDGLVQFYDLDPAQLRGGFDLAFFVNVLKEQVADILGLLRGTVAVEYWLEDYPRPIPVDEADEIGPTGLRQKLAFNYAAAHPDERIQAALLGLMSRADMKQTVLMPQVKRHRLYGGVPLVPEVPTRPLDFLFMVIAVARSLAPGEPARRLLDRDSHG